MASSCQFGTFFGFSSPAHFSIFKVPNKSLPSLSKSTVMALNPAQHLSGGALLALFLEAAMFAELRLGEGWQSYGPPPLLHPGNTEHGNGAPCPDEKY